MRVLVAVGVRVGARVDVEVGLKVEVGAGVLVGEVIAVMRDVSWLVAVGVGAAGARQAVSNKARSNQNNLRYCICYSCSKDAVLQTMIASPYAIAVCSIESPFLKVNYQVLDKR